MTSVDSPPVTYEEIGPRICVTPPYFALHDLTSERPGRASADVPVQSRTGRQVTRINVAEAGRHLAILGLCAAASAHPSSARHYYLAHRGVGRMYPPLDAAGGLTGTATARMVGRNRASAETVLHDSAGNLVARLDLEYLVMREPVFRRLLGTPTEPDATQPANPYSGAAPLSDVAVHARTATAKLAVESAMCRGHFDGYPALPVSVAGYAAFALFDHVHEMTEGADAGWQAGVYRLRADSLAAAGQLCTVDVEPSDPAEPETHGRAFTGTVRSGDREVFSIEVDYSTV